MLEFVRGAYNQAVLPGITRPLHTTDRNSLKKMSLKKFQVIWQPYTTSIWELCWIISSQMTRTFRDNCDKNIVLQTSCEPLFPDVQTSNAVKNLLCRSFCTPMYASQFWRTFRKWCMQILHMAYNFGCRAPYNLPWRASVSSLDSSDSM